MKLVSYLIRVGLRVGLHIVFALLTTASSNALLSFTATESASAQLQPCGTFSDYLVPPANSQSSVDASGLHYPIMPSRYRDLNEAIIGNRLSGYDLVAFDGNNFQPAGFSDDPGIYLLIPWLVKHMHMTLAASITMFFLWSLGVGMFVGCLGFLFSLRTTAGKVASLVGVMLLGLIARRIGDLYLFEFTVPVALVPWALYFVSRRSSSRGLWIYVCLAGLVTGIAGLIRTSAALPTLCFLMALLLLVNRMQFTRRAVAACFLVCGFFLPKLYVYDLSLGRDAFLAKTAIGQQVETTRHVFWHFAYIGLGFLSNAYVPGGICDEVGKAKVQAIDPKAGYLSAAYNHVLQRETLVIVRQHPTIVLLTLFAKLGIVACLFITFANIGLVAMFLHRKPMQLELAFWIALASCAGPLLIMAPLPLYSVGLISWAAIYGIVSLDHAFHARQRQLLHEIDMTEPAVAMAVTIGEGSSPKTPFECLP